MSITFPWYADLGSAPSPGEGGWDQQFPKYSLYWRYYSGIHLNKKAGNNGPELFPVRMNLVKMLCLAQADAVWGEWDARLFTFVTSKHWNKSQLHSHNDEYLRYLHALYDYNDMNERSWEGALDRQRFGGSVYKVSPDPDSPVRIRIERVPVTAFYPVWNPNNLNDLLEVYFAQNISPAAAQRLYGINAASDIRRVEHWTKFSYTTYVGGERIARYSGEHDWGMVPFAYIPRFRSDGFYGEALTEEIMGAQDELNMRVADNGDSLSYNAHPIRYGYNLPADIDDPEKYPNEPEALWNLGRARPGMDPPFLGILQANTPVPQGTQDHVSFVYDWARTAANAPPIAFGEDNGGGQRSGTTLLIRLWPLVRAVKRDRMYMQSGYRRITNISMAILRNNFPTFLPRQVHTAHQESVLNLRFAPILPRDRTEIVNEIVQRISTNPPTVSLSKSLEMLGENDIEAEMAAIAEQVEKRRQQDIPAQEVPDTQDQ